MQKWKARNCKSNEMSQKTEVRKGDMRQKKGRDVNNQAPVVASFNGERKTNQRMARV